jgi:hypothetical protein
MNNEKCDICGKLYCLDIYKSCPFCNNLYSEEEIISSLKNKKVEDLEDYEIEFLNNLNNKM